MASSTTLAIPHARIGQLRRFQIALWLLAAGFFLWAWLDPSFRNGDGSMSGRICLPIVGALGLAIYSRGLVGRLNRFWGWLAIGLIGQALALQMIDAGPTLHYQHYRSLPELAQSEPFVLGAFVLQTVFVVVGMRQLVRDIGGWLTRSFSRWQLIAVGLVFVLTSATVSRQVSVYLTELPFATLVQIVNVGTLVLMVRALPNESLDRINRTFERVVGSTQNRELGKARPVDHFALVVACWVTCVAAILTVVVYQEHPHITDEVVYLFHARTLAQGSLVLPAPPVPAAFDINLVQLQGDRWYASTPPGWPAMLAVGEFVGTPWLVNPILAGLNVVLASILVEQLYDRRRARMTLLLLAGSPWYLFMAMNFMTHMFTLTCALLGAVALNRACARKSVPWGLIAGAAVGVASLIRPLDGLIVGGLLGLWAIGLGGSRLKLMPLAAFVLGGALFGALVLPYNQYLTGRPTVFPIQAYDDEHFGRDSDAYGFGPHVGMGWPLQPFPSQGHTPLAGLVNADLNAFSTNIELFGWSTGSLILAALLTFAGKKQRSDYLMLAVVVATVALYFPYYYSGGPDFGARYWFLVIVPLAVLTVRGIDVLRDKLEAPSADPRRVGMRLVVAVAVLSLCTLVNYFPWRTLDKYYHYLDMRPDVPALASEHSFGKSLVLVRGEAFPDYASAAIYNPIDLHSDATVYAWDQSPQTRAAVIHAYTDRPVWIVDGPTVTHAGYRLVTGPLTAQQALTAQTGTP